MKGPLVLLSVVFLVYIVNRYYVHRPFVIPVVRREP